MNIIILIVLAVGAVVGFSRGAFKMIASIGGFFVGVIVASMYSEKVGEFLSLNVGTSSNMGKLLAFILIMFLAPVALDVIATLLTKVFSSLQLGFLNRLAGAAVGAIGYAFVLSFALNMMDFALSNGGFAQEKLEEREPAFYLVKHLSQPVIPDMVIVDDPTEVAQLDEDETPRCGLKPKVDEAVDNLNPFK